MKDLMKSETVSPLAGRKCGLLGILALVAIISAPALAHHSYAMFDASRTVVHTGTVKKFLWVNPHTLLVLSVRNSEGEVEEFRFAADGPGYLVRNGWSRTILKPGDEVSVTSHPLRNDGPGGALLSITLADGRELTARPQLLTADDAEVDE